MANSTGKQFSRHEATPIAVDLRRFFHTAFERSGLLLLVVAGTLALGYYQSANVTPVYRSNAVLQIVDDFEDSIEDVMQLRRLMSRNRPDELNTIAQSITHQEFLKEVVEARQWHLNPEFSGATTNQVSVDAMAAMLQGIVQPVVRYDTFFLDVFATHPNPEVAQKIATGVAEAFSKYHLRRRIESAKEVSGYLVKEAEDLKLKIETADREILAYKKENNTVSFEDQKNNVAEEVNVLNQQYLQAKSQRVQLESDLAEIKRLGTNSTEIAKLPSVQSAETVAKAKQLLSDQVAKVAALERVFKAKYPKLIDAKRELADRQVALGDAILEAAEYVEAAYGAELARETSLQRALQETEQEALRIQDLAIHYDILLRDRNTDQAVYESILRRIREAGMTEDFKKGRIEFVEAAALPKGPANPGVKARLIIYAVVGGVLAGCLLLVFYLMDSSIKTVDEAEAYFGVPVLGAIPAGDTKGKADSRRIMEKEPQSRCAEAFRSLRTSIALLGPAEERKLIAFTSADPGEGKSFACSNLAIAEAVQGRRTVLVDLDLRRPTVTDSWDIDRDVPGVTNVLRGEKNLDEVIRPTGVDSLSLLSAGPLVPNPAEQLASPRTKEMIEELTSRFDLVMLDTAPVNAVSDTLSLLPHVDVVAVIVKSGKTPRKGVARCIEMISRAGIKVDGTVLNFLPTQAGYGYYYYYQSRDAYGAEGVYGSGEKTSKRQRS